MKDYEVPGEAVSSAPGGVGLAWRRRLLALAAVAGLAAACLLLYFVPPGAGGFYPPCVFHAATGLHCPGCGATRCGHALLHGELRQAAAYNVLVVLALPFLLGWGLWALCRALAGLPPPVFRLPAWAFYLLFALLGVFGVLRNLPFAPFCWLAPHAF